MTRAPLAVLAIAMLALPRLASAADPFSFDPPGELVADSGAGRVDTRVYAPSIRFPIESGPAYANSQVYARGGSIAGDQCDTRNYSYPWHDNYCETRDWSMPLCPSGTGHQGQDVRAATCKKGVHSAVAVVDGTITNVGSYSVYLTAADGTRFDYLHMQDVAVVVGQKVARGDLMGKVSNQFGTTSTTVHLHFNIRQNVAGVGSVYVPPYTSLVKAYEDLLGIAPAPDDAGVVVDGSAPPPAPPGATAHDAAASASADADAGVAEASSPPSEAGCVCGVTRARTPDLAFGLLAAGAAALAMARRRQRA